jgi:hypothetical protein
VLRCGHRLIARLPSQKGSFLKTTLAGVLSGLFGAAVVEGSEVGPDLVGFWLTEVCVEG